MKADVYQIIQTDFVFTLSFKVLGLCQNKKHEFDQYTKGGHFCAAHMALKGENFVSRQYLSSGQGANTFYLCPYSLIHCLPGGIQVQVDVKHLLLNFGD